MITRRNYYYKCVVSYSFVIAMLLLSLLGAFSMPILAEEEDGGIGTETISPSSSISSLSEETKAEMGESCRVELLQEWLTLQQQETEAEATADTAALNYPSLVAMRETSLYQLLVDDCDYYIRQFNDAAGATCLLQNGLQDHRYSGLWESTAANSNKGLWTLGPINLDGGWMLAADLVVSNQLQDARPLLPCADSCYVHDPFASDSDNGDCLLDAAIPATSPLLHGMKDILSTSLQDQLRPPQPRDEAGDFNFMEEELPPPPPLEPKQRILCDLQWFQADTAYHNLRVCAAESIVARTMISENDMDVPRNSNNVYGASNRIQQTSTAAKAYARHREQQAACAKAAVEQVCPTLLIYDTGRQEGPFGPNTVDGNFPTEIFIPPDDDYGSGSKVTTPFHWVATLAAVFLFLASLW